MGIELLSDESILRFYEDIRQQVAADLATENRFRLMGGVSSSSFARRAASAERICGRISIGIGPQRPSRSAAGWRHEAGRCDARTTLRHAAHSTQGANW
jgi:hypothetical protein